MNRRLIRFFAAIGTVLVLALTVVPSPVRAQQLVPVTVTIIRVVEVSCDDGAFTKCPDDYYAKVNIAGQGFERSSTTYTDKGDVSPFWRFTRQVDRSQALALVDIEIWDEDNASGDDRLDISAQGDVLNLALDLVTGTWSGDVAPDLGYSKGGNARVFFDITIGSNGDADGDGLLDSWEQRGYDHDGDGVVDVDLPAMGADWRHKDLFLELDYMPGRQPSRLLIQQMKEMFANAPSYAGGSLNPDGQPGIRLWVDTGALTDGNGNLVGDNFGGGSLITPDRPMCGFDGPFYDLKRANFNQARRYIFRYAIRANATSSCRSGGQGELGGNDFVDHNWDAGSTAHELGHTLGLRHGGFENSPNCKPNYLSIMNYSYQFGINQQGGRIIDFSPPRFAGGRASVTQPLTENQLNDAIIVGPSDPDSFFVFSGPDGQPTQSAMNQMVDWNGDGVFDSQLTQNLDNFPDNRGCKNRSSSETLSSHNDWNSIRLPLYLFGDSDDGAVNPVTEPEPTTAELERFQQDLNTTDLTLSADTSPAVAIAGEQLTYRLSIANIGRNPARDPQLAVVLPAGLTYQSDDGGCAEGPQGTLTCQPVAVHARRTQVISIVALVDPALVYNNGGPASLTTTARVSHNAGPDTNEANNTTSLTTQVVAAADLAVSQFVVQSAPPLLRLNQSASVTLSSSLSNSGPSGPIDGQLTFKATASPGIAVDLPAAAPVSALAHGEERPANNQIMLTCQQAGPQTVSVTATLSPLNQGDSDPSEANNQANLNFSVDCTTRVVDGLSALYTFEEQGGAVAHDVAGVEAPLDLTIADPANVSWTPGGLRVDAPTLIASDQAATKISDSVVGSGELTIEAWVAPSDPMSHNIERIVTISSDATSRNVALLQQWDEVEDAPSYTGCLRTTETSEHCKQHLSTPAGHVSGDLTHVVYTRDANGIARLYVNGASKADTVVGGDLSVWDRSYRLALANELSGDRPWQGEYQLVAIYHRALSAAEVGENYDAQPSGHGAVEASGVQALYRFDEGGGSVVHDTSGREESLDLQIADPTAVQWGVGGLTLLQPTRLLSSGPASRLIEAAQATGELTIEAWVTPAMTTIDRPAQIVAIGSDAYHRNIVLAQQQWNAPGQERYSARIRTTQSYEGSPILRTPNHSLVLRRTHVVLTRDATGVTRIYLDGVQQAQRRYRGALTNWEPSYALVLGNDNGAGEVPWLGTYHSLMIANRAYGQAEVLDRFLAGQ